MTGNGSLTWQPLGLLTTVKPPAPRGRYDNNELSPARGKIAGLTKYATKNCGIGATLSALRTRASGKTYSAAKGVQLSILALLTGAKAGRQIEGRGRQQQKKNEDFRSPCRNTIGGLLGEKRSADAIDKNVTELATVCRSQRIDRPERFAGLRAASLDGIDLGEVCRGYKPCPLCLSREVKVKGPDGLEITETRFYHFAVVIVLHTTVGPIPIGYELAKNDEVASDVVSAEKIKQDCEMKIARRLLARLAANSKGKLPFDVLFTDALHGNAPSMESIESFGCLAVSVLKDERRQLRLEAEAEFDFGLNPEIGERQWKRRSSRNGDRLFFAQTLTLIDEHRTRKNKEVTVTRIVRTEDESNESINYFLSTPSTRLTPQVIEELRYAKWGDLENRTFNTLTNSFGILKQLPFHSESAIVSYIGLVLLVLAVTTLYRFRNLCRGGRHCTSTIKEFLEHMLSDFLQMRKTRGILFPQGP